MILLRFPVIYTNGRFALHKTRTSCKQDGHVMAKYLVCIPYDNVHIIRRRYGPSTHWRFLSKLFYIKVRYANGTIYNFVIVGNVDDDETFIDQVVRQYEERYNDNYVANKKTHNDNNIFVRMRFGMKSAIICRRCVFFQIKFRKIIKL